MGKHKIHLHSMVIHAVAALAPLAAIAYIFYQLQVQFLGFEQSTWRFLVYLSLIGIFLSLFPSIPSGIFERNHIYAKWHSTHKVKLVFSLLLVLAELVELVLLYQNGLTGGLFSLNGLLIIFANNIIVFVLCVYGLKISLGRQSWGKASYEPDLFKKEPVDILVSAAENRRQQPKYLDLLTER